MERLLGASNDEIFRRQKALVREILIERDRLPDGPVPTSLADLRHDFRMLVEPGARPANARKFLTMIRRLIDEGVIMLKAGSLDDPPAKIFLELPAKDTGRRGQR